MIWLKITLAAAKLVDSAPALVNEILFFVCFYSIDFDLRNRSKNNFNDFCCCCSLSNENNVKYVVLVD